MPAKNIHLESLFKKTMSVTQSSIIELMIGAECTNINSKNIQPTLYVKQKNPQSFGGYGGGCGCFMDFLIAWTIYGTITPQKRIVMIILKLIANSLVYIAIECDHLL